jgi:aryl-alcohol dehydrogenase-like predicted oxidoreductase
MTYGSTKWRPWVLEEDASRPFIRRAWEAGINFFDTADIYSKGVSEEILGRALRELTIPREQVIIATKVCQPLGETANERGLSRKHIRHSIDASLRRLQLDYVGLYQIHRFDSTVPADEIMEALDDVVRTGKALAIGASSMYAWQFAQALYTAERHGWTRFVSMQNYYNLLYREEEREMLPLCRDQQIAVIPWSPLARGRLTRDWDASSSRMETDEVGKRLYAVAEAADRQVVERVAEIAAQRGIPHAQVALAWLAHKPNVTAPIVGASKPHHLDDAVAALSVALSKEEIGQLEEPYQPHPVLGFA